MTHRLEYKTSSPKNIFYRKGDVAKELAMFVQSKSRYGYDIIVPQCFSLNINQSGKLCQKLYGFFPNLYQNLEIFVSDKKHYAHTQFVECNNINNKNLNKLIFANMICVKNTKAKRKLDYISLAKCMSEISLYIKNRVVNTENDQIQIVGSKFGTGFLGGNWTFIEQLICDSWENLTTTIYNYDHEKIY